MVAAAEVLFDGESGDVQEVRRDEVAIRGGRPTFFQLQKMEQAARSAAKRYRGSRARGVDPQDLEQAAWLELLRAQRTFDPDAGTPFYGYCWRVAISACRRHVLETRSPATGGIHHRVERGRHLRGVGVDTAAAAPRLVSDESPHNAYCEAERCAQIESRLRATLGDVCDVALGLVEETAPQLAYRRGIPLDEAQALRRGVRAALREDEELFKMWRDTQW
jgi:hypothetical protein